jgi:hypothetical protein
MYQEFSKIHVIKMKLKSSFQSIYSVGSNPVNAQKTIERDPHSFLTKTKKLN